MLRVKQIKHQNNFYFYMYITQALSYKALILISISFLAAFLLKMR